jgi:hypothetical protein
MHECILQPAVDSVLQDKKFLLSQLHKDSLMKGAYDVEKYYTG